MIICDLSYVIIVDYMYDYIQYIYNIYIKHNKILDILKREREGDPHINAHNILALNINMNICQL